MNKEKISVSLDKELVRWVEREAEKERRSRSSLIEVAVAEYREHREEPEIRDETRKRTFISTRPLVRA